MILSDRMVRIIISANVADALRGLASVQGGLRNVGNAGQSAQRETESFGDKLKKAAAAAGIVTGFAAVTGAITSVIRTGVSFQDNMNNLRAVTQASDAEMTALSATARALGNDIELPATSAGDAAEAMLELSKGGLTVNESMTAAKGTLLLAAAASVTGAEAAEIQANALNAFGLEAARANDVADILANTSNAASGEITDLAAALKQSGGVAASFGISIEDSATTLGLFAKNGLIGSDAGTSFKAMLIALSSPTNAQAKAMDALNLTVYDAQGNFVGMRSVTEQLTAAKQNLSMEEYNAAAATTFGSDAVRGANFLAAEGVGAWDDMAGAVGRAGGAQELAAAKTQGVSGAFGKLMNAVEEVSLSLFDKFSPAMESGLGVAAGMVGAIGGLVGFFGDLPAPIQAGAAALTALIVLKGPLLALWTAAKATGVGLAIQGEMLAARLAMQSVRLQAAATGTSMGAMGAAMRVAGVAAVGLGNSLKAAFLSNPIGLAIVAATTALTFFMSSSDEATAATEGLTGAIDAQTGALSENAARQLADAAVKSGAAQAYKNLGGNVSDYVDAMGGVPGAQEKVNSVIEAGRAAYEASQAAVQEATAGTGNFGAALDAVGPSIFDVNAAQDFLAASGSNLAGQQNDVALATEGVSGALGSEEGALDGAAGATEDAVGPTQALKDATDGLAGAAQYADAAVQFLTASLDAASGSAISNEQATRLNDAALRNIKTAAADYADAQDGVTEAAIKVREAQAKVDEVTKNLGKSQEEGGTTADDLTQAQLDLSEANRNNELATGKVVDATDKQFDANIAAQQSALTLATSLYSQKKAAGDLTGATQVATASLQASKDAFIAAQPEADRLSGKAQAAADALFGIPADTVARIAAQDNASGTIDSVRGKLAAIDGYTAWTTVGTRYVIEGNPTTKISSPGTGGMEDGGVVHAAMGRLVSGRGMSMVRDGSGAGLTWAEAATNKEYYLSMKAGMESRNRMLAAAAVRDLGGQAVFGERQISPVMPSQQPVYSRPQSGGRSIDGRSPIQFGDVHVGHVEDVQNMINMRLMTANF